MSGYTLYHGDCLDVLPGLEAQSIDAVICDPPYGTTACKWDSVIPFDPMWRELKRLIKPRGAIVLFGSQPFTSALVMSNPKWFRYEWVWDKHTPTGFLNAQKQPLRQHENIVLFCEGQVRTYNPQKWLKPYATTDKPYRRAETYTKTGQVANGSGVYRPDDNPLKNGSGYRDVYSFPKSILHFPKANGFSKADKEHPTQKPLALLEYLIRTYTNAGDTVLDFTMGSGTCGHAAANTGRRFVGIEKDLNYYNIAAERIATAYAPLRMMQGVA